MLGQNKVKARLRAGEIAFGAELLYPAPDLAEIFGYLAMDFVYLDQEHSANDHEQLLHAIRAAEIGGVTPLVRLPESTDGKYGPQALRVLDLGAMGVICPQVDNAEVAREIVSAAKYQPLGSRGMFPGGRQSGYGRRMSVTEYMERANEEVLVVAMIESGEGVKNLDSILEVPGLDVLLVGGSDLSQSLGCPGRYDDERLLSAINTVITKAAEAGVGSGVGAFASFAPEAQANFLRLGARFVNINSTNLVVSGVTAWRERLEQFET